MLLFVQAAMVEVAAAVAPVVVAAAIVDLVETIS